MRILFIILFFSTVANAQIATRYHFPPPVVIIDTVPDEDPPEEPGRPPDSITLTYLTLPEGSPASYSNQSNIIIENKRFTNLNPLVNGGNIFNFNNCTNVIIRNCFFDASVGNAIDDYASSNFLVENCLFANNKTGAYFTNSEDVIVQDCEMINPCGPFARGQFVQFNTVSTSATGQCRVRRNRVESFLGESKPEDIINIYHSNGRAGAPIDVSENIIRGGGPSMSGGGILIGDDGGSYQTSANNKVWNSGNYGLSISGGSNMTMTANYLWIDTHRDVDVWSNVGFIVWAQGSSSLPCASNVYTNNKGYVVTTRFGANPFFDGGNCTFTNTGNVYLNNSSDTTAFKIEMAFPDRVITKLSENDLWIKRNESQQFKVDGVWVNRATVAAEADKTISGTTTTLTTSGTPTSPQGGFHYQWTQISGPNTAGITNGATQTCSLSGLVAGVYEFRIVLASDQGDGAADWVILTVN